MHPDADIQKLPRHFLPADFAVTDWENLKPYFDELLNRPLDSLDALQQWLRDMSELEAAVNEDVCWRQIRMTCDTENKELEAAFEYFVTQIQPKIHPVADALNRRLVECPFTEQLDQREYGTYLRSVRKQIELFREANVPILAELGVLQQHYGQITGRMTVEHGGQEYTLQQASKFLLSKDRSEREAVYRKIQDRRLQDHEALDDLFDKLLEKRHEVALNAGFDNYRDYKFRELGRFDYTPQDCERFHEGVRRHIIPLVEDLYEHKRRELGVNTLRPWDLEAEPEGVEPLRPFANGQELLEKSIRVLDRLDPFFGDCFRTMQRLGHFDLESRKGKAPGGYNCPLAESGAPFIFMNAAGQMDDVTTMVHEGGHAVHSFLAHKLPLNAFKEYPMEIAEVASMAMELFTMEHWDAFFDNPDELRRAKLHQLERAITIFPWIAVIDKFQHWLYTNPGHSRQQRGDAWMGLLDEFRVSNLDVSGLEAFRRYNWQRQLHLYEVPFYYIEYGVAQLGAFGLWQQYLEDPAEALNRYRQALSLGGTRTLPELYAAAGLRFDFSPEHIESLMRFVLPHMKSLQS